MYHAGQNKKNYFNGTQCKFVSIQRRFHHNQTYIDKNTKRRSHEQSVTPFTLCKLNKTLRTQRND